MPLKKNILSENEKKKIFSHALKEYPDECCGIVTENIQIGTRTLFPCTNIQNQLHTNDPKNNPRDAKTAYCIDPAEIFSITKKTEEEQGKIIAFYHSHTDHDVYFSEEDTKNALFFDTPTYSGVTYIIISVYNALIKDIGFFQWDEKEKKFARILVIDTP